MNPDILDLVQESIALCDRDGRITAWNAGAERLYGWSRMAANRQPIHKLLQTRPQTAAIIEAALRTEGRWEGDLERRTANGALITVHLTCALHGADQIIETGIDVTAQRRADHRYDDVFHAMAVSFWELDFTAVVPIVQRLLQAGISDLADHFARHPEIVGDMIRATRVIDINDQSVALFGRDDKQEMLGTLEPYWPPASYPAYAASVVAAVQGLPHHAAETRLSSIDGRERDVRFTACFPTDILTTGKLLIGVIDISADKQARLALEASEERYRGLFDFLPVALVQMDRRELARVFKALHAQGVRDLKAHFAAHPEFYQYAADSIRIVEVNDRTVELFSAHDPGQLLGPAARLWSEASDAIQDSMAARFAGAARFGVEMKIRTFDDRIRDVLYVAHFPEAFDQEALGLCCLVDISDRVKAQSMLAQIQADFTHAARVSMLGELTASIAHEVNQPLGAILTNGEATIRWLNRPVPDVAELRSLAARTVVDAQRAADIIRRIRSMATRAEPEQVPLALNSVIQEVMLFLNPELKRQDVSAVLDLAPGLPDVMADRIQLQQVFTNLAINAIQAMMGHAERRLTIRTAYLDDNNMCAEVEDTGPGILADQLDQVFQSFFTTKAEGLGIGLAICRSIVEAHGGQIEAVNPGNGRGARFRFILPALLA